MASKLVTKGFKWLCVVSGSVAVGAVLYSSQTEKIPLSVLCTSVTSFSKWDHNWDKRHASSLVRPLIDENDPIEQNRVNEEKTTKAATATRHIFLIRHGQYETKMDSDKDRKLTVLGQKQADLVGERLKSLNINYTKLIHSTMTRARETSEFILHHFPDLPVETNDMLREGYPIPVEPPIGSWNPEYMYYKDGPRIEGAYRKYFRRATPKQKTDSYEIIVCHANVIRYFVCRLLQVPPEAWLRFSLHHCSITRATIFPNGSVSLYAVGESGFMPIDKLSRV